MNPVRDWNRFWFAPISARPLGAFRVVFGIVFLLNLGFLAFDLDYWFTDAGLLQGNEALVVAGTYRISLLNWVQDPLSVRVYFLATAVVGVLFTLGWHTRATGIVLYLAMLSIHHRNLVSNCGADALVVIMLFYLMLSPCGAAYSLDARRAARKRGTPAEPLIVPWAQRLIQLQLALIYFNTAVLKCHGESWLTGTALHYVLHNTEVGRSQLVWLVEYPLVLNVLSQGALLVEFVIPFLLWFKPTRVWAALAGLGLHAGVLVTVNIPIFGEVMTACYLTFLAPDELAALLRMLDPRRWFRQARPAGVPSSGNLRIDPPGHVAGPHGRHDAMVSDHASRGETR